MAHSFAERENSRNVKFRVDALQWMSGLSNADDMAARIHHHLKAHRKIRNLTQAAVADGIGVMHNTVSGWETGSRKMDMDDLEKLAGFYGVHPAILLLAPEDGPKFEAMRQASKLAERMGPEVAADWLRMGERLAPESTKD